MRAVVQTVTDASIVADDTLTGGIDRGLLVYLGVKQSDTDTDVRYTVDKIANLRVFRDANGKMNVSALELGLPALVVSQFTLYGDTRKGRRPSYNDAAEPDIAVKLYERFVELFRAYGVRVETGRFQASMRVKYVNDGPVTILIDSEKKF
ncbi:MAG: D-tyrosyl-tRNA(Tyr) deacylase [Spirochaetaceae bacterium]|nr:MAG: D-tyrosyl-tRNA(Tyr) deacylase [Spirochaetaceae bacterium]